MEKSINAIRFLGLDQINKANSGHPGIVLGAAPMMYTLFTKHLRVTPSETDWINRDRFVLSAGHGSAMLYATLHLCGFDVTIDDLKDFRQINSKTPGHPEYKHTDGVEATTGPLGQGIGNATGMAIAEAYLAAKFNKEKHQIIDHFTYTLCGDGDLQEGVAQEAMSLAGHLGLGKLIVLYDSNDVQLDGPTTEAITEDIKGKYEAMNWHYSRVEDGNDVEALNEAINTAKEVTDKPSIIEVKTVIGFGSSKAGKSDAHGKPLGEEETNKMRQAFDYETKPFEVSAEVFEDFRENSRKRGYMDYSEWETRLEEYETEYPELGEELRAFMNDEITINVNDLLAPQPIGTKEATRVSSGRTVDAISKNLFTFIGGSADLSSSTKVSGLNGNFSMATPQGRNINFGVREHAMAAIVNGLTLHDLRGFTGGFFVFSDYMKPSLRLAAIMGIPSLFVFTHDSVAVGEDGPTHEPIEQLSMLRTMPNFKVYRPMDANETQFAYQCALDSTDHPSAIVLTRQDVEVKTETSFEDFKKGAYVVKDYENYEGILIATGSEVNLALDVQAALAEDDVYVRVVSMPCMETFKEQSDEYKESILPKEKTKRLAIELGAPDLWYQFASHVKGIDRFGVSGDGAEALKYFGFDVDTVKELYLNIKD
ncbi:MAG: transketolase [Candidatus Izemoplasma sp.]|nr:transketolase [Candidatus Izemoplasma sp.]